MVRPAESWLYLIHLIVEAGIIVGYVIGLIPFLYVWSSGWVVPLTIISVILALVGGKRMLLPTVVNLIMALLSFIPLVGYIPRVIGILLSLMNMNTLRKYM